MPAVLLLVHVALAAAARVKILLRLAQHIFGDEVGRSTRATVGGTYQGGLGYVSCAAAAGGEVTVALTLDAFADDGPVMVTTSVSRTAIYPVACEPTR